MGRRGLDTPEAPIEGASRVPRGFRLLPGFVEPAELEAISAWIAARVSWSCGTSCGNRLETFVEGPRPLPEWGSSLGKRMVEAGIFPVTPNYLHLIEYKVGSGIPTHVDRDELGEVVAGLTLGSSRVFQIHRKEDGPPVVRVLLRPGDLYVLSGVARHRFFHGVPYARADEIRGRVYPRADGFSASWRRFPEGRTWISDYARTRNGTGVCSVASASSTNPASPSGAGPSRGSERLRGGAKTL